MRFAKYSIVLFLLAATVSGQEPAGGQAMKMSMSTADGPLDLQFRYCPSGTLSPGQPKSPPPTPVEMQPFYILETEVTGDLFSKVLGAERLQAIKQRSGVSLQDLLNDPALPVFHVDFDDVSDFCQQLTQLYQPQQDQQGSQLETRRFRLPTHLEWQYACRAATEADAVTRLPHFNSWPQSLRVLDRIVQSKCLEEWEEMGRTDEFTGTQEQVIAIVSARHKPDNPKPLAILRAFLQVGLGTQRDYATTPDPPPLTKPRSGKANAWNIFDMHNNVREWTLVVPDQDQALETWGNLTDPEAREKLKRKGLFFLSGGSFVDNAFGTTGWKKFAIWGGFTQSISGDDVGLILSTGEIVGFSLKDLEDSDLLYEQVPGFRIVMTRGLRDDWQQFVRNTVVNDAPLDEQTFAQFDRYRRTVQELASAEQRDSALAQVDFYAALAATRLGKKDEAKRLLQSESMKPLRQSDPYFADLAELIGKPVGDP